MEIREWKPTKRQEDFLTIPDSVFEALYGGAAGGGKSETLLMLPLVREFYKHSDFKGLILRRTYPELERELIIRSRDPYTATGAVYNESKKSWRWPAYGSYIQFGYAEHEKDVRNYDTAEYNYMAFDELTSFTEFQYKYLAYSRCRSKADSGLPAIVRNGTNPGNVGHGFVRAHFVEPSPSGYTILRTKFSDDKVVSRIYIPAKATDNPHVDPNYIVRLQMLPEAERRAKLDGDWWTFTGQVFDDWRISPFSDEPSNAQHVIKPFKIPDWWPHVLAIDWGFSAMMWAGFGAISPDRRINLFREHTCTKTKISQWATDLGNLVRQDHANYVDVVLDPSAWSSRGDEFTIAQQFEQYSGLVPRKADNDRLGGKILMQEVLRWRSKPTTKILPGDGFDMQHAEWLRRNKGTPAYNAYVDKYVPEAPEPNIPILQVFDDCTKFIETIPLCVYNDKTKDVGSKNPEDVAEFNGDDPYDGGRYLVKACMRYLDSIGKEAGRREKIEQICQQVQRSGDMTSFYIKMGNLDARSKRHATPRRRLRRYARNRFGR
ncbi:MAG: hypothetical protein WAV13_04635 [Thermodesulfovibrionales bacterium]